MKTYHKKRETIWKCFYFYHPYHKMSLLGFMLAITSNSQSNTATKTFNSILRYLYAVCLCFAVFLAVVYDNSHMTGTLKIWNFVFAFTMPEFYLVLRGISSSKLGTSYLSTQTLPNLDNTFSSSTPYKFSDPLDSKYSSVKNSEGMMPENSFQLALRESASRVNLGSPSTTDSTK